MKLIIVWLARVVTILYQLYLIPKVINILGIEEYGVVALTQGLVGWFVLLEFGGGGYFQKELSVLNKNEKLQCFNLYLLSIIIVISFFSAILIINAESLKVYLMGSSASDDYFVYSILLLGSYTFVELSTKVLYARQKAHLVGLQLILSTILSFIFINYHNDYDLVDVLICILLPQIVFKSFNFLYLVIDLRLYSVGFINPIDGCKAMFKEMKLFFYFSLICTITLNLDVLILNRYVDPVGIGIYYLISKIYNTGFIFYSSYLQVLWPKIVINYNDKNLNEINRIIFRLLFIFSSLIIIASFILYYSSEIILPLLNVNEIESLPLELVSIFAVYFILRVITDCYSVVIQCSGQVSILNRVVLIQAILSVLFQIYFIKSMGVFGLMLGLVLSFLLTVVIYLPYVYHFKVGNRNGI